MKRLIAFVFAGGVGFVADAGALALILAVTPINPLIARLFSIGFALTVTWLLNRSLTWGPSGRALAVEGARYGGVGIATGVINYVAYSALLLAVPTLPPLAALAIAAPVAMVFSYFGYSKLVFDRPAERREPR